MWNSAPCTTVVPTILTREQQKIKRDKRQKKVGKKKKEEFIYGKKKSGHENEKS